MAHYTTRREATSRTVARYIHPLPGPHVDDVRARGVDLGRSRPGGSLDEVHRSREGVGVWDRRLLEAPAGSADDAVCLHQAGDAVVPADLAAALELGVDP